MFKCNEILMIGARYELLKFQQDIDFLIHDKSHDLFKHLSPDIQTAFINIYKLTHSTIKSIDENNLRNFAQSKYKLDISKIPNYHFIGDKGNKKNGRAARHCRFLNSFCLSETDIPTHPK